MKNIRSMIWSIFVVLAFCSGSVGAVQLSAVPTADAVASGTVELAYTCGGVHAVGLELGLHPNFSAGVRQVVGGRFYVTAKAVLMEETAQLPGIAVGGEFSSGSQDLYAVLSKQLGAPHLRGHLAWGLGRYSRGMAGVTLMLNPVKVSSVPTTSLFMEYDGHNLSGGVTAQFSPELGANLGVALGRGLNFGIHFKLAF